MTYRSNYEIQGKFYFFDSDEHLRREWKQQAKMNIRQPTFLEGILLKSMDHESKYLTRVAIEKTSCLSSNFVCPMYQLYTLLD